MFPFILLEELAWIFTKMQKIISFLAFKGRKLTAQLLEKLAAHPGFYVKSFNQSNLSMQKLNPINWNQAAFEIISNLNLAS